MSVQQGVGLVKIPAVSEIEEDAAAEMKCSVRPFGKILFVVLALNYGIVDGRILQSQPGTDVPVHLLQGKKTDAFLTAAVFIRCRFQRLKRLPGFLHIVHDLVPVPERIAGPGNRDKQQNTHHEGQHPVQNIQ